MQISFSASEYRREYHCEYHREYHFANIILKTENRARRHRTEMQRIFALSILALKAMATFFNYIRMEPMTSANWPKKSWICQWHPYLPLLLYKL